MTAKISKLTQIELKAEVERLWHREAFFDAMQEVAHFGYCEWDYKNNRIITCTQNYAQIFGMSIDEIIESQGSWQKVLNQIHPQDRDRYALSYQSELGAGVHEFEYRIFRKDGEIRHIKEAGVIIPEAPGGRGNSVRMLQDITEHKLREQELENRDEMSRHAEAITDIGHFIWDMNEDHYAYISEGFAKIHGVTVDEFLQKITSWEDDLADVHEDDREAFQNAYNPGMVQFEDYELEYRIYRPDGKLLWIREQSSMVKNPETESWNLIGVLQDITEQKRNEQRLHEDRDSLEEEVQQRTAELAETIGQLQREANERERVSVKLEKKNAELERFTYTVSHDLKSPLVTIKGFIGMLARDLDAQKTDQVADDLARISDAADTMAVLLDDLLELSRIGQIIGERKDCNLSALARQAAESLKTMIDEGSIEVQVNDMPTVGVDALKIREVFQNLIENAIKFMGDQKHPSIIIEAEERPDSVSCSVKDNGIGIDSKYQQQVFELFERLDNEVPGTGIGLTVVKRVIEVHGGNIQVKSDGPGLGTTILFTLSKSE